MTTPAAIPDLSTIPALSHLPACTLAAMSRIARINTFRPGEVLVYQDSPMHSFFIVLRGAVRLAEYGSTGQTVALKIYGPGDIFGLLAVSGSHTHNAQVESIHETLVATLNGADTRQLILEHPQLGLTIIDLLTSHVHHAHYRIRDMAAKRVEQRLARALLHLAEKFGQQQGAITSINLPLSQRDLADYVSTTVETINRTLTAWERQEIVRCSHKHVDVLDQASLAAIAEDPNFIIQS